jgi:hypothetical protein
MVGTTHTYEQPTRSDGLDIWKSHELCRFFPKVQMSGTTYRARYRRAARWWSALLTTNLARTFWTLYVRVKFLCYTEKSGNLTRK